MTILAAAVDESAAWIAADSLMLHWQAGYGEPATKIARLGNEDLAWAWFGSTDQGDSLELFLRDQGEMITWDNLSFRLENVVRNLDLGAGSQRFGAVFAGHLDGELGFRSFARYPYEFAKEEGQSVFVGVNRLLAAVGWKLTADNENTEDRLRQVMQATIDVSHPMLEGPLQLWRVSKGYCSQV